MLVFTGISIERVEQNKEEDADESGGGETPSPAEMNEEDAEDRNANSGGKFGHRIENGRGKAALLFREPVADGFGVCGEGGRLADSQKQAGGEEAADAGGDGSAKGSDGPENRAPAADALYSEAIEQQTRRNLERRIRPIVGAR